MTDNLSYKRGDEFGLIKYSRKCLRQGDCRLPCLFRKQKNNRKSKSVTFCIQARTADGKVYRPRFFQTNTALFGRACEICLFAKMENDILTIGLSAQIRSKIFGLRLCNLQYQKVQSLLQ